MKPPHIDLCPKEIRINILGKTVTHMVLSVHSLKLCVIATNLAGFLT